MKILYWAHLLHNKEILGHKDSDEYILEALRELGHKVYPFDDRVFDIKKLLKKRNSVDLLLFHKGGVGIIPRGKQGARTGWGDFYLTLERLSIILQNFKRPKKVFWYFDRVFNRGAFSHREVWMQRVIPQVDCGFLVDETWIRRHRYTNIFPLKQGATSDMKELGDYNEEFEADIAFVGSLYEERELWWNLIKQRYGKRAKHFQNVWGKDFRDLCQTAKIIIAPPHPTDDFYWSARFYYTLGAGGFLVHPKLYGLKEEGFRDGYHYIGYTSLKDMFLKLDYFLSPRTYLTREQVKKNGRELVFKKYTYKHRCKTLLEKLEKC